MPPISSLHLQELETPVWERTCATNRATKSIKTILVIGKDKHLTQISNQLLEQVNILQWFGATHRIMELIDAGGRYSHHVRPCGQRIYFHSNTATPPRPTLSTRQLQSVHPNQYDEKLKVNHCWRPLEQVAPGPGVSSRSNSIMIESVWAEVTTDVVVPTLLCRCVNSWYRVPVNVWRTLLLFFSCRAQRACAQHETGVEVPGQDEVSEETLHHPPPRVPHHLPPLPQPLHRGRLCVGQWIPLSLLSSRLKSKLKQLHFHDTELRRIHFLFITPSNSGCHSRWSVFVGALRFQIQRADLGFLLSPNDDG